MRPQSSRLVAAVVELQESERRDLARELHDRVGQNLTALKFNLETLRPKPDVPGGDAINARVNDSAALLASTMETIYNVMCELRPPMLDEIGLAAALDWHARNFSQRTGIAVTVRGGEPGEARPGPQVRDRALSHRPGGAEQRGEHAKAQRATSRSRAPTANS
jgi:signal transduction histidine kinase